MKSAELFGLKVVVELGAESLFSQSSLSHSEQALLPKRADSTLRARLHLQCSYRGQGVGSEEVSDGLCSRTVSGKATEAADGAPTRGLSSRAQDEVLRCS